MFDANSRYAPLETSCFRTADGREIAYAKRRFLPRGTDLPLMLETPAFESGRLDLLAARMFGDPEQYWRICDANNAMNPALLPGEAGKRLRVPVPQVEVPR